MENLSILAASLGTTLTVYLVAMGCLWLFGRIDMLKADKDYKNMQVLQIGFSTAAEAVERVSAAVVGKLEQVSAKELRDRVKAGLESREALCALADEAYDEIISTVAPELISALGSGLSDVETYIRSLIEKQVLIAKQTDSKTDNKDSR